MARPKKEVENKETKVEAKKPKVIESEIVEQVIEENPKSGQRMSRKKNTQNKYINLDRDRVVPIVSVSNTPIGYVNKETNKFIKWNSYGDEYELKIGEVIAMMGESEKYLKSWLIVDDMEVIEAFGLEELYETIFEMEDLETFFKKNSTTIKDKLSMLPTNMRTDVLNRTVSMIYNGEISDLKIVSMLKREYNITIEI